MGKKSGGAQVDSGEGIAVDASGNCWVTGQFSGTASFGGIQLNSAGNADIFIAKLDPDGNFLWAKRAGGTSNDIANSIAVDSHGNSFITGLFYSTAFFGKTQLTASGGHDIFIAKLGANGNFLWARKAGGNGADTGMAISIDSLGHVYITGFFYLIAYFGDTELITGGYNNIFVARLHTSGSFLWAVSAYGSNSDVGYGIAVDPSHNSYITVFNKFWFNSA